MRKPFNNLEWIRIACNVQNRKIKAFKLSGAGDLSINNKAEQLFLSQRAKYLKPPNLISLISNSMRTGTAKLYIPAEALTRKISSYDLGMVFNQNNKTMVNSDLKNVVPVQGAFAGGTSFNALY